MSNKYYKAITFIASLTLLSITLISVYNTHKLSESYRALTSDIVICETRHIDSLYYASPDTIIFNENYEIIQPNPENFYSFSKGNYIEFTRHPNSNLWERRAIVVIE